MKIIKSKNYNKLKVSTFEGQVFTPETEDDFAEDVLRETQRRKRNSLYPSKIPSSYRAKSPSTVPPVSREHFMGIKNKARDFGESSLLQNEEEKQRRREKILEKQKRLNQDYKSYEDVSPEKEVEMIKEITEWEKRTGKKIPQRYINLIKRKYKQMYPEKTQIPNLIDPPKKRNLIQLNRKDRVAYTIHDDAIVDYEDNKERETLFEFLEYIDNQINDFASLKEIDPEFLKDFLNKE
jgi:hypothetical protein